MTGSARTLRVAIVSVRAQEPRRYHVSVQLLGTGSLPPGVVAGKDAAYASRPDQVARTETSEVSRNPGFAACSFVLRAAQPLQPAAFGDKPLLRVELFATTTMESPGATASGRDLDELVGSAVLSYNSDTAARLLRGDRVTAALPLTLDGELKDTAGGWSGLGKGETAPTGGPLGGVGLATALGVNRAAKEVILELMLLDARIVMPGDAAVAKAAAMTMPRGPREARLHVLVSRAENLPLVMGEDGVEHEPDTFVAVNSRRDGAPNMMAQGLTRVVERSTRPSWNQVLTVRYDETELAAGREQLLLAVVNNTSHRLMIKAALPLAALLPGRHYNLRLLLPGGPLGSSVQLYVTLVLAEAPGLQHRHLRAHMNAAKQLLQTRLSTVSGPLLKSLGGPDPAAAGGGGQVFGVWRVVGEKAAAEVPALAGLGAVVGDPYTSIETGSEASMAATLRGMAEVHTAAIRAQAQNNASAPEAMPLQGDTAAELLWPPDHMATLIAGASSAVPQVLQLALYHVPSPTQAATATRATAAGAVMLTAGEQEDPAGHASPAVRIEDPEPSQAERLLGAPEGPAIHSSWAGGAEGGTAYSSPSKRPSILASTAAAAAVAAGGQRPSRLIGLATVPLAPRPAVGLGPGEVQVFHGVAVKSLVGGEARSSAAKPAAAPPPASPKAAAAAGEEGGEAQAAGEGAEGAGEAKASGEATGAGAAAEANGADASATVLAAPGAGEGATLGLELRRRDTAAVVATLESEALQDDPLASHNSAGSTVLGGWAGHEGAVAPLASWGAAATAVDAAATWPASPGATRTGANGTALNGTTGTGGGVAAALAAASAGPTLETLVEDSILKQGALGALVRQLDGLAAQLQVAAMRGAEAESRCRNTQDDNEQLRTLLHEEKEAWRVPQLLGDAGTLTREELVERCEACMAAYGRERRRNTELVHRLQQLHAEQMETMELKKRHQALQEAHMEQARTYGDLEALSGKTAGLRTTIKTQEEVIKNLEALLQQAVGKAKEASQEAADQRGHREDAGLNREKLRLAEDKISSLEEKIKEMTEQAHQLEHELMRAQMAGKMEVGQEEIRRLEGEATLKAQADAALAAAREEAEAALQAAREQAAAEVEAAKEAQQESEERHAAAAKWAEDRIKELEEDLKTAYEQVEAAQHANDEAEVPEQVQRLEGDVAALTGEKTAALLRAEYAEGAAEAAQAELIDTTKRFAREIAELKARLAEKDAQLMGGFGDLEALRRGDLPPPQPPGGLGSPGKPHPGPPPGMIMPGHTQGRDRRPSNSSAALPPPAPGRVRSADGPGHGPGPGAPGHGSPGSGSFRGGGGGQRMGSAGSQQGLLPPIRGSGSGSFSTGTPPDSGRGSPAGARGQQQPQASQPSMSKQNGKHYGDVDVAKKGPQQQQQQQPAGRGREEEDDEDEEFSDEEDEGETGSEEEGSEEADSVPQPGYKQQQQAAARAGGVQRRQ
ncbi:hypothetical protein HYH03_005442 [Edaphochlamys debaryana]|uniref:C2 domain-containing protein n=1 Tax=Edaphochlamys debaryana TaxID=47281 RepID=A0A835Y5Y2_9CHLO|nr:hypothetical protein HYH03_005442 [Edaphochlamys debaryana]|eukprot:KAG2496621.1 hypothetical protein HYH03_005442 [Edaphochlamys debaryana]